MQKLPDAQGHSGKWTSIQFLRALAVLLVLYGHSLDTQVEFASSWQQGVFFKSHFGAIGVDIFFVISGFIISWSAGIYLGKPAARRFLAHRFVRLVPLYWTATALFFVLQFHHMWKTGDFPTMPAVLKTVWILPFAETISFIMPMMFVAWTLAFEWLFYLVFFSLIRFSILRKEIFLLGLIAGFVLAGQIIRPTDIRLNFLTNPLLLEFLVGVLICASLTRVRISKSVAGCLLLGAIIIVGIEIWEGVDGIYDVRRVLASYGAMKRFIVWGIPAGALVAGCIFFETTGVLKSLFNNKWIMLLGDASYSLYLTHLSVYGLITALYTRWGFFMNADLAVFFQLFTAIAVGLLFYRWVETPILQKLRNR